MTCATSKVAHYDPDNLSSMDTQWDGKPERKDMSKAAPNLEKLQGEARYYINRNHPGPVDKLGRLLPLTGVMAAFANEKLGHAASNTDVLVEVHDRLEK